MRVWFQELVASHLV